MASLACCVLGLDDVKPFLVDIPLSKTVDHLKKAVKKEKEPTLNHIAADQLEIWKVGDSAQCNHHYQFAATLAAPESPFEMIFPRHLERSSTVQTSWARFGLNP